MMENNAGGVGAYIGGKGRGTNQVRILELLDNGNVIELDVEVLVHALQDSADLDVVLKLYRDLVVDEGFEEAGGWRLVSMDLVTG